MEEQDRWLFRGSAFRLIQRLQKQLLGQAMRQEVQAAQPNVDQCRVEQHLSRLPVAGRNLLNDMQ